jgi:Uma2 family endonuclease
MSQFSREAIAKKGRGSDGAAMNIPTKQRRPTPSDIPLLVNGDRMTQAEFHRRYEAYPDRTKFELIGGVVYMASPLSADHGEFHLTLGMVIGYYTTHTPGTQGLDNATNILGEESEPQPDLTLRIRTKFGGQSLETKEHYTQGGPELLVEISYSTRAIDLNDKRRDYERAGVQEYMVLNLEDAELVWFDFAAQSSIMADKRGIARSRVFPGLWIDVPALLANDGKALIAAVNRGLKSAAHAAFVKKLGAEK